MCLGEYPNDTQDITFRLMKRDSDKYFFLPEGIYIVREREMTEFQPSCV